MTRTLIALVLSALAGTSIAQECGNYTVEELRPRGGRVDWSHGPGDMIAFDHDENLNGQFDGYFDVSVMPLATRVPVCITCTVPAERMGRNRGQPAWHPSGQYIVFQAEIAGSTIDPKWSNPGRGVNNVLWLTDKDGSWFVQLTDFSAAATGVLHPHFHLAADGTTLLSWSEQYGSSKPLVPGQGAGSWRLKKAKLNFASNPPRLEEITTYRPVEDLQMRAGFYENHGFSPDGRSLIFSSNALRSGLLDSINNDIFALDLESRAVKRLTETGYNEHATFFPDGRHVLWMTNRRNPDRGTDLWVMDAPRLRAREQRLTYFNVEGCPGADGLAIAADSSINAAGDALVVFVQRGLFHDDGPIFRVTFPRP